MSAERRKERRNPCYLKAEILLNTEPGPVPAEAHDISEHGMRLVVLNAKKLPDEFIVSIPRRHIQEIVYVVRREDKEVGVRIKTVAPPPVRKF
jgi:PilZ domain